MSEEQVVDPQEEEKEDVVVETKEELATAKFQNRVKELRTVRAKDLLSNPKNWRIHSERQEDVLTDVMKKVGFADALLARETEDGELILVDGHLRKDLAEDDEVPVLILDITEKEADYILATHDAITGLAITNDEQLDKLLANFDDEDLKTASLIHEDDCPELEAWERLDPVVWGDPDAEEDGVDVNPEELDGRVMSEDELADEEEKLVHIWEKIYDSELPYGVPPMDIEKCAPMPPKSVATYMGITDNAEGLDDEDTWWLLLYGREPKSKQSLLPIERTILGFYVDDWRFEGMWTNPVPSLARLKAFDLQYAITPNFSLYAEFPMAVQLFNVYRSRWVGCAMQDAGILTIPDVQWSDDASFEYCFLGIPKGCPCVSIQFHTRGAEDETGIRERGVEELMNRVEPQGLLIYGGDATSEADSISKSYDIPVKYIESRWNILDDQKDK